MATNEPRSLEADAGRRGRRRSPGGNAPIGRAPAYETIRSGLTLPAPRGAVLVGESGIGKSHLLDAVASSLPPEDFALFEARASATSQPIPFGAVLHLFEAAGVPAPSAAAHAVPSLAGALLESKVAPIVIVADDADLLDEQSQQLMLHLCDVHGATMLAAAAGKELPQFVDVLLRRGAVAFVELEPMDLASEVELVAALLGGDPGEVTTQRLRDLTGGLPRDICEVVQAVQASGGFQVTDGFFTWNGVVPVTARVEHVALAQVSHLSDELRDSLELVAVASPIGQKLIEELVPPEHLVALERDGLLAVRQDDRRREVMVSNSLLRETLCQRLPSTLLARHQRAIVDLHLTRGANRKNDVLRISSLRLDATGQGDAAELAAASWRATLNYDNSTGERLARAAMQVRGGPRAAMALAFALSMQNKFEESEVILRDWWDAAMNDDRRQVARPFAYQRIMTLHRALGRFEDAEKVVAEAAAAFTDKAWKDQIRGIHAYVVGLIDVRRGSAIGRSVVEDENGDLLGQVYALQATIAAEVYAGRTDDADRILAPFLERAKSLGAVFPRAAGFVGSLGVLIDLHAGEIDGVIEGANRVIARQTSRSDHQALGAVGLNKGMALRLAGRLGEARAALENSLQHLNVSDPAVLRPRALMTLARVYAECGDATRANASLTSSLEYEPTRGASELFVAEHAAATAWTHAARQDFESARGTAERALAAIELPALKLRFAISAHRLGVSDRLVAGAVTEGGPGRQSALLALMADHINSLVEHSRARDLVQIGGRYAEMGLSLLAVETWTVASLTMRQEGNGRSAGRIAAQADALMRSRCPEAQTPLVLQLTAPELTRREQEVAFHTTMGLSNAEIADLLGRSVRTVEWHLQQVYAKLGVSNRQDLAEVLTPDPLVHDIGR